MALTMPAKTWEKGGSGNASTASSSANSFTITKDNPLYEASLRLEKKKAEAAAKQLEEDKRKKYEEDKVKAKYYADNIQPFVKTLNDVVNQTGGFFDKWRNQNESNYTQGLYTSLNGHYTKLRDSVTDNSYLKDVLSEDEYIRLEREVNAIGKSIDDAISGVKSASDVYAQYGSADDYDRHLRLSGMSSDELQKQIDDLDKKSDYMSKLDSSYETIKVMGDDVLKPTKEYDDFRKKTESDRVELTSYLNNAKYNEESRKHGIDPKSMTYDEITALINDGNLSRKQPEKYDFIKRYYDSMSNADWQMQRSEEFVKGLDTVDLDWLKKAADAVDIVVSTTNDSHATSEAGHTLKRAYEVLGSRNGWSEEEIRDNIDLAKLYLDSEDREKRKKVISEKFAESPVISPILSNAASVLANIPGSLMSLGDSVYQSIYNKYTGNDLPINTNSASSDLLNLTNDIREATREKIEKNTTAKLPNGKNLGVFAYDALMNIADVASASAIGGLSAAGKGLNAKELAKSIAKVSGTITSSSAAANKVQESIASGDSNGVAIAKGAIVGAIEALTERFQIDNLVAGIVKGDTAIKTVLKGALSEGTEEVVSNILAEDIMELAFGNGVRVSRSYNDYLAQGYKKERALEKAILDMVGEDAETFVSAAIAGAAFGGMGAVSTRANDKTNTKMAQDAVANEIGGRGDISFLRGINSIMAAAEESPDDVSVAQAAQMVNDRITYLEDVKKNLSENGSLKRVIGEKGVKAEIEKVNTVENSLKETLGLIRDGSYDATIQDYLITQKEIAYNSDAQATALGDSKLRAAAQKYVDSVGSVKKAIESLVKTRSDIDTETAALKQEKKTIQESIRNGSADANAKKRLGEINTAIRKNTRDADRAEKLTSALTGNQEKFLNNALGADQKRISKALSDASGRNVSVRYDSTMGENEMAAMRTSKSGVSTLALNPERILRAQAELEAMGESGVNVARGKVVHEAGHLAARTDGTFVPKVYEVYASLRDSKVIPTYAVNEADIKAGYGESVAAFLKTKSALEEKNDLVANKGMSEEEATRLLEERYMQEEYVMHFLEYMENNGANLYNTIVPEKRNAFVEAMRKIAQFFRDIAAKIRGKDPASAKKMESLADKLYNAVADFAGGSRAAQESVKAKTAENTTAAESVESEGSTGTREEDERKYLVIGDETAVAEDGDTRYSIKSMRHDIAEGKMFDDLVRVGVFSREDADTLRDNLDRLVKYMIPFAGTVDMNEEYGQGDRPFRAYKPNSDPLYVISLDFSTLCRKRLMTQYVIEQLQLRENRPMTAEEQIAIRSMLLDYRKQNKALQVACAMCYVEAARLKAPKQMEKFFTDTESILKTYFAKKDSEFNAKVRRAQEEFKVSRGYEADTPKSGMKGKDVTALNRMSSEMRRGYEPSEEQAAIIETAKSLPRSTFLTAANLTELSVNHPEIYDAYTSHIRASTRSKSLEGDIPYYYGDSEGIVSDSFIENVNEENGFRFDSWSDFQMKHMLDMITAVIELSVRGSKMHGYTKFPEMVRIFGKTGMMFNLSGVAAGNGFDADGNLAFSDVEGMAYEDAVKLRNDFPETAGFQCIGVSHDHIRALLRSDDIDYVIPYHTSGLNATLRRMVDIYGWKDYTGVQNAKKDPNAKKPANAENWQVEPVWSEFYVSDGKDGYDSMRKTAQRYIDMCHERGLIPKFNDFTDEPNYWKLLIDRKMVNQKTGALIEQKPVRPDFDFGLIEDEVKREVSEYDPKLEQDALNYVVDNFDAIGSRIRELKKIAPKKKLQTVGNEVLQAYAEGSKVVDDERKSLATDSAYMSAIERGDMDEVQRMVDEAAKKAGYAVKAYHGTPTGGFTSFDYSKIGSNTGVGRGRFSFTSDKATADVYSDKKNVTPRASTLVSNLNSLFHEYDSDDIRELFRGDTDEGMVTWDADVVIGDGALDGGYITFDYDWEDNDPELYSSPSEARYAEGLAKYNGTRAYLVDTLKDYQRNAPESTKPFFKAAFEMLENASADRTPMTYSVYIPSPGKVYKANTETYNKVAWDAAYDSANVTAVELDNGETRYFVRNAEDIKSADPITYDDNGNVIPLSQRFNEENDDIRYSKETTDKRIARLKEDKEFLKQQMEKSRSVALSPADVDKIVKEMRDQFGFDNSERDNVKKMLELIDKVVNKKIKPERMDEVWDSLVRGSRSILEGVYEVDASLMKENEAFIKHIRSTPLSVPEKNESDLAGGYAEYRNENRKYVNLSRNGTPVETVYAAICEQYPGMIDPTVTNPAYMIDEIVRAMKALEPVDVPSYADTMDQAAQEFAHVLGVKYMNTAQKTYFSDVHDEVSKLKRENRQTVTAYEARLRSIESAAERDAKEYERIINRYKNIEDAREFAGDRKEYARRIRQDAHAIRSAAVSPNRKKFVPEKYRANVERIAVWLDRVSVLGRNIHKDNASEAAFAFVRSDFQALTELFGDDFYSIASGLLGQMEFYASDLTQMESKDLKEAIFFRDAYKLGRLMRTSIANQNKVYLSGKNENATEVGSRIKDTLEKRKGKQKEFESLADKKRSGKGMKVLNEVYNKNLSFTDGYSFFHRMGKVGDSIFETLQGAQSRQVLYVKSYTDTISEKLKGVDLSKYAGAKQKTVSVTLESGKEFSMTAAQAMSAVTLFERENGRSHMEKGGIQIYDPKTRQLSRATALTEADIAALRNALDEEDKRVMKVFADFMRDECTAWGNKATMEKYGFHRFTTANYFPIKVNRDATGADMKTFAPSQFNVENVGFAKSAKEDASAPIVIGSMIDVANAHVSGMATYAAYLNVEDGINRVLKVDGVKDAMRRALGSDAEKYITEMMNDLKGAGKDTKLSDNAVEVLNKMAGRYKAAAVSYNASTVTKQPLSYLRAAAVIGEKYLGKGVIGDKKQAFEQMMQYSGIAVRKEIGYSDVGVGKTVGDRIGYTEKGTFAYAEGKFNEFGMMGAAAADRLTWEALWIACRAEQAEKNASAALNNDALMQATAKRFAEVVARTQVVDSALTSAPVSRSGNGLVRLSYAFTSEPIKNYNMLVTAIDDLVNADDKAAKSRAAKHIARVSVYTAIGWAIEAAITSAFQALRDDDDDFFGKFGETYLPNLLENTAGLLVMFDPIAETLKTKFQGYDVTSMADQPLADLVDNLIDLWDVVIKNKDGKRETEAKIIRDTFESISTLAGMPMKNLFRILTNARKALFHSLNLYKAEYNFQKFWYNPDNATAREKNEFNSLLADAYISGDKEAYEYIYEDMRKSGLKPQSIVSSIAKDAYAGDIADSEKSTLVKYTPGSDAWYIGMKTIFDRDENAPKATEDEITRVYKATSETSVLPKFKDGKYTVDGVSKEFDGASLDKYLEDYGRLYYEVANAMRDLAAYRRGSAEEQAWWLTKAERFASAVAVYTQDKDYSVTSVGKWVTDYIGKKPYEVAKYIVGNLEKK